MRQKSDNIKVLIKREIAGKLWGGKAYFEAGFKMDEVMQKAVELIEEDDKYSRILRGIELGEG